MENHHHHRAPSSSPRKSTVCCNILKQHWFRCSDHAMMFDYLFSSPSLVGRHLSIVSLKGLRCRP